MPKCMDAFTKFGSDATHRPGLSMWYVVLPPGEAAAARASILRCFDMDQTTKLRV